MGKFAEKQQQIKDQAATQGSKKTHNEAMFNELSTALFNEPDHAVEVVGMEKGEKVVKTTLPVADLRTALIGQVAKQAGADATEQKRLIAEAQFGTLPFYGFVAEAQEQYLRAGKRFTYPTKDDMKASLTIDSVEEKTKVTTNPKTREEGQLTTGAHMKLKANSDCPEHHKTRSK